MRPFKIPNNAPFQDTTMGTRNECQNEKSVTKHHGTRNGCQNEKSVTIKKGDYPLIQVLRCFRQPLYFNDIINYNFNLTI